MEHGDHNPGCRVWFLANNQRHQGILLRIDRTGVVIKERDGEMMWCSGRDTEGKL